ncbi:ribonuclease H-like domain-containing protein, partial [Tanacetum coccineum]
ADGTLSCYKARLVANGSSQQLGVDIDETFSSVVKPATIRTILSFAVSRQWPIHQLDVKNDFLNSDLSETVYMHQPPGFVDNRYPHHFDITDLGALNYFVGISADRTPTEYNWRQEGLLFKDPTLISSLQGAPVSYFYTSRLSYSVQRICPLYCLIEEPHLAALKRILRYVQGTLDLGLHIYASFTTSLVGYIDADWAGCPSTRRSTLGYCVFLGDNLLSWSAKRQHTLSRFSVEAEYRGVANVVAETAWLRNILRELHSLLSTATLVYCDNVSVVYMSVNPVQHQWTKHIEIDIHFVRDMVTASQVRVLHVPFHFQYADILTKGLPSAFFEEFRSSLSVQPPPALTAGAY